MTEYKPHEPEIPPQAKDYKPDFNKDKLDKDSQAFELECEKAEIALLERRYEKLLSRWADIQHWYETADRSAHSWVELDKIMENQDA